MVEYENIDNKLARVKYNPDNCSHLQPDFEACKKCKSKACVYICPANVYNWDEDKQELSVFYENCLECGACRIACEKQSLVWKYPKGKFGITLKNG